VFCAPPPPALDGGYDSDADWVARGLTSSGDGSFVASTLRWSGALLLPGGEGGGGAEDACGIPDGGEEDEDRGREVQGGVDEALVAGTRTELQGRGASLDVEGDRDGRGPDDCAADAPPRYVSEGGSLFPPPVDVDRRGPVDGDGWNGGDKK
jgi:hypothetical protein